MKIDFRIDFGYQYTYSRRHYHPVYIWDGELTVDGGEIQETYRLHYPYMWFGCAQSAKEEKLDSPKWKISTKRGITGLRFVAEVNENAVFHFRTTSFDFDFTAKDIMEKGKIENVVGPKYQRCFADVIQTGYYWFMPKAKPGQTMLLAKDLYLETHNWARTEIAWLKPGQSLDIPYEVKPLSADKHYIETLFHIVGMLVPDYRATELPVTARLNMELYCDGKLIKEFFHSYRFHDSISQLIEDTWIRVNIPSGKHILTLKHKHKKFSLGINRILISDHERKHGELSLPLWTISGEREMGKVFSIKEEKMVIDCNGEKITVDAKQGWNEFSFTTNDEKEIALSNAYDEKKTEVLPKQTGLPVKVGYDLTVVPHDESGWMDWLIDYTYRTKLGNYLLFRSFLKYEPEKTEDEEEEEELAWSDYVDGEVNCIEFMPTEPASPPLMNAWGKMCKDRKIYVSDCRTFLSGALKKGAREYFHDCGLHEYPGVVYAFDPTEPYKSKDMKEASEKFIDYLKIEIDKAKTVHDVPAFGDSSGGIRYSYFAGAQYVRAETMVCHTQLLLSSARPVTQALGDGRWGVHIAIQHTFFANKEVQLGQYFLSLMQPWMMGADCIYEEDSLFSMFKEERQAWDDFLPKRKREMTRNFYKFTQTVPRHGKNKIDIGFIDGRYAAPFNGIICDKEQDPHYSVWGIFGNEAPTWGHGQPEKCRQLLDVFMPGASTHPFRQKFDKRRFFFSGTPYGDFDAIPVEANAEFYKNYKLLLHLGWNTMLEEDYSKLKAYVENGGVLLTGIPQFSTHIQREFLADMRDLSLYNGGDISELTGIKVVGRGAIYSGQWNGKDKINVQTQELSAMPSDDIKEDGEPYLADVELAGAEMIAWDMQTGAPMLVRYRLGKGYVYTFTFWAYPGHENFQQFSADWIAYLAKEILSEIYVKDSSKEVFWTKWVDGDKTQIMLLNTDYMEKDGVKRVEIIANGKSYPLSVQERIAYVVEVEKEGIKVNEYSL